MAITTYILSTKEMSKELRSATYTAGAYFDLGERVKPIGLEMDQYGYISVLTNHPEDWYIDVTPTGSGTRLNLINPHTGVIHAEEWTYEEDRALASYLRYAIEDFFGITDEE